MLRDEPSQDKVHNALEDSFGTASALSRRLTEALSQLKEKALSQVFASVTATRAVASRCDVSRKGA